ncbi:RNA-binding (RRM/RBD/RNP motifs) family protein [Wolffia australiana]
MADSPRKRSYSPRADRGAYRRSRSPFPSPSRPRARSRSRSRSRSGSAGRDETGNPGNTLYVTGLSTRVTERDLETHFSKEGKVAKCFLVVEPRTRISRGFAFVTMDSLEGAERCIKYLNQSVLQGRYITVEKSKRRRPRTPTPGNYLGVKSTRETSRYNDRIGHRGGDYGRDDYGYRRSPRRSYYRGGGGGGGRGGDYSPPPFGGGRSRRDRSRSLPYSPYRSPEGGYGRRRSDYAP